MTNSISQAEQHNANQSDPLPAVAGYLQVLNTQILPVFANTGSVPNAINARDGLANLTHTFVTDMVTVPLMIDDIVESDTSIVTSNAYDVPVRIFCPSVPEKSSSPAKKSALPVMIYFHGGGGTAGSVSVYYQILCRLAKRTGHIVVAPEYRLAPENPYPSAQNDACTVLLGINEVLQRHNIDTTGNIVVAGDSHGGALVSNLLRDPRITQTAVGQQIIERISAQVLIYPSVDFTMSCPSIDTYASGYLLSKERINWYFEQYFQHGEDRQEQSALFASQEALASQPPALIINAAIDPLHDEGVAYAEKLSNAGVDAQHICFDGVIHAYLNMENLNPDVCEQTYQAIADFLQQ